ncbi:MAG: hypothetical protein C4527_16460 [Candidatus Omnitrophota bacterium]|jgi:hypothetical protein|nr:MAG: hypothetical protein C4527_16460 [Candidatus Omnitrophota bacterium]
MKKSFAVLACFMVMIGNLGFTQTPDTEAWPPQTDFSQEIHFWSAGGFLPIPEGRGNTVVDNLVILTGGDQVTQDVTVAGKPAKKSVAAYLNVADDLNFVWIDYYAVDILVQYFADVQSVRNNAFLIGSLPTLRTSPSSYDRVTDQFEWRLFRVDNADGLFGFQVDPGQPGSQYGGVNGGTVRFEQSVNLIIRAIAIAPAGTFGEPDDINQPASQIEFDPDGYAILAEWDINKGVVNGVNLYVVNGGDQESVISENIGPAGDKRKAARAAFDNGQDGVRDIYLNWEILDEHFGPTSQPASRVKIAVEYYDDPQLAGESFGPEAYAGPGGVISFVPEDQRVVLEGSGRWRQGVWFVDAVKLNGVNVPTQAAVRFYFSAPVYLSRYRMGIFRISGIYEGIDPIPDASDFDPDLYDNYAEWDINKGVVDGLDLGSSGGDQEWIIDNGIGPANDKRTAVRSALNLGSTPFDRYINWAILNERFGPSSQPNARFKICIEYFDDPALAGLAFGPEVYQTESLGVTKFAFVPAEQRLTIEGTGLWRSYSWVIENMNFTGVNVSPQGAARFVFNDNGPVYISRVRYAVIRTIGSQAGVDRLAGCGENETVTNITDWSIQ